VLEEIVKKYSKGESSKVSAAKRFRDDVKLAFKAKDIATFETRIQRDINELHTALGLNSMSIE
jgi:hypothetical protein